MSLAAAAGKQIKKVVLELGGSDPFIVLDTADIEAAAATAVTARLLNNGQTCIAAKRFIVMETVADQFEQLLVAKFQALRVGDPLDETVDIGLWPRYRSSRKLPIKSKKPSLWVVKSLWVVNV